MAAGLAHSRRAQMAAQGVRMITPAEGTAALARLLGQSAPQVGVFALDWAKLQAREPALARIPFLDNFVAQGEGPSKTGSPKTEPSKTGARLTRGALAAAAEPQRSEQLRAYLVRQAAEVLHVPAGELNAEEPLTFLGLDSLMALELRNRIEADLQLNVPVTQLLTGTSVHDLQQMLAANFAVVENTSAAPQPAPDDPGQLLRAAEEDPAAVLAQLDEMSEENIDRLLQELLADEGLNA